jgi:hypothetical protein
MTGTAQCLEAGAVQGTSSLQHEFPIGSSCGCCCCLVASFDRFGPCCCGCREQFILAAGETSTVLGRPGRASAVTRYSGAKPEKAVEGG